MLRLLKNDLRVYSGNRWAPGYRVMKVYRFGRMRYNIKSPIIRKPLSFLYKILYYRIVLRTGIELPCEVEIGKNFRIDHQNGIVISGYTVFGDNCVIRNGVTIGLKNTDNPTAPKIGNNVDIGTGAKILGSIRIGDNVIIGANAVVIKDVPSNCVVAGIPAKIIKEI